MRCEGFRRRGGAFTMGPVRWEQCENKATVILKVEQEGEKKTFPACNECWNEAIDNGIKILMSRPVRVKKGKTKS